VCVCASQWARVVEITTAGPCPAAATVALAYAPAAAAVAAAATSAATTDAKVLRWAVAGGGKGSAALIGPGPWGAATDLSHGCSAELQTYGGGARVPAAKKDPAKNKAPNNKGKRAKEADPGEVDPGEEGDELDKPPKKAAKAASLPGSCAARRSPQKGSHACQHCAEKYATCIGAYDVRDASGIWSQKTSDDLSAWLE